MDASPRSRADGERQFAIGRTAELAGTTPSTLRSWERRHGFPSPPRRSGGHRVYSRGELDLIREVVSRIRAGQAAGNAIADVRLSASSEPATSVPTLAELVDGFVGAVANLNVERAQSELRSAWELHDWRSLSAGFVVPSMREIGIRWEQGALGIAAEHLATHLVRQQLLAFLRFLGRETGGPQAVVACAPDEQHELGAIMLAATLRRRCWEVLYLGQRVPLTDLVAAAQSAHASAAFISATMPDSLVALHHLPAAVIAPSGNATRYIIGGQVVDGAIGDLPGPPVIVAPGDGLDALLLELEDDWRHRPQATF